MAERKLKVEKDGEKFAVVDDTGEIVETLFPTRAAANKAIAKFRAGTTVDPDATTEPDADADDEGDTETDPLTEAEEEERGEELNELGEATDEETEWNPHGLSPHQRITAILQALRKRGIHIAENVHPAQNANTAPQNFARRPAEGINALPPDDPETLPPLTAETAETAETDE